MFVRPRELDPALGPARLDHACAVETARLTTGETVLESLILYGVVLVILTIPIVNIFLRAGLNGALGFITLVPFIGLFIAIAILAFREWPNEPAGYR